MLKDRGATSPNFIEGLFGPMGDVFTVQQYLSAVGAHETNQVFRKYRLAGPACANNVLDLPLLHLKGHTPQHFLLSEALMNVSKLYHRQPPVKRAPNN